MDIVVLGGTGFLSRQVVREALRRGHTVAALTRGARGIPPDGAKDLRADRDSAESLATALQGLHPGAVIDCSGYTVEGAQNAAGCLAGVRSYVYVSSLNAYRSWPPGPVRGEDEPLWAEGEGNRSDYGPTKAASERILSAAVGDRLLIVRAGLIIGPGDDTGRMTSWLQRIAAGGRVIVPDCLDQPMAFVDVRDLAAWMVSAVEHRWSGPVNATGPVGMTTFGQLLEACRAVVAESGAPPAQLLVVDEQRLLAAGIRPWRELPFWLPRQTAATAWQVDTSRARELDLPSRPIRDTLTCTWQWMRQIGLVLPAAGAGGPGMPDEMQERITSGAPG